MDFLLLSIPITVASEWMYMYLCTLHYVTIHQWSSLKWIQGIIQWFSFGFVIWLYYQNSSRIPDFQFLFWVGYIRININITMPVKRILLFYFHLCYSNHNDAPLILHFAVFFRNTLPALSLRILPRGLEVRFVVGGFHLENGSIVGSLTSLT